MENNSNDRSDLGKQVEKVWIEWYEKGIRSQNHESME